MLLTVKSIFVLLAFIFPLTSYAATKITSINIKNDIVYFSTEQNKSHTPPSCATTNPLNQWAISLTSSAGRNLYKALLTANSTGKMIDIESAQDCLADVTVEHPASITVQLL